MEAGDFIPADGRLIDVQNLRVEEGMLTGESEPVEKFSDLIEGEAALGDRKNMVFSSSLVVYGRADFVVTAIAEQTEIGKIAQMLETAEAKQTPLQQKLEKFGKQLGWAILALCALILPCKFFASLRQIKRLICKKLFLIRSCLQLQLR